MNVDIYRFFHPHHNPRLHCTSLRQQEVSELEQCAAELRKALERARRRVKRNPKPPVFPEHFDDTIRAMIFVERSLQTLCDAHSGDMPEELMELINERAGSVGWDTWTSLLREQLTIDSETKVDH